MEQIRVAAASKSLGRAAWILLPAIFVLSPMVAVYTNIQYSTLPSIGGRDLAQEIHGCAGILILDDTELHVYVVEHNSVRRLLREGGPLHGAASLGAAFCSYKMKVPSNALLIIDGNEYKVESCHRANNILDAMVVVGDSLECIEQEVARPGRATGSTALIDALEYTVVFAFVSYAALAAITTRNESRHDIVECIFLIEGLNYRFPATALHLLIAAGTAGLSLLAAASIAELVGAASGYSTSLVKYLLLAPRGVLAAVLAASLPVGLCGLMRGVECDRHE